MNFNVENFDGIKEDVKALILDHHKDVQPFQDLVPNPDWEKYYRLEELNVLRIYTVRDEGNLAGYAVFYVSQHMQYMDSIQAVQDLIYLKPEYRKTGYGKAFIKWIDSELEQEGVDIISHHTKSAKSFAPLLESLGYIETDIIYSKKLT